MSMRRTVCLVVAIAIAILAGSTSVDARPALVSSAVSAPSGVVEVSQAVHSDVSEPLSSVVAANSPSAIGAESSAHPARSLGKSVTTDQTPSVDSSTPESVTGGVDGPMPSPLANFEGTSNLDGVYPPDPNGDIGPNNYVQIVNTNTNIFTRSGVSILGAFPNNTFFTGFGGACETHNDGDPIVKYDRIADRWIISQFAVGPTAPFFECVAVSRTSDPTGAYARYAFPYTFFPDYPKLTVWPDGYYAAFAKFDAITKSFIGPEICAFDRARMLAALPATQQCRAVPALFNDLVLPSDLDGSTLPPIGAPNHLVGLNFGASPGNQLQYWDFHVDWAVPGNSSLSGPTLLSTDPYSISCGGNPDTPCVPQPGTGQRLDSLGDRIMWRVAYRNFGDHESLTASHTVSVGAGVLGVRWYEIRLPGGVPAVFQQGTLNPGDTVSRWMGSVAMDHSGDLAVGYSVSGSNVFPGIRYSGRLVGDPAGTLPQTETTLIAGTGAQTGVDGRWGDYSAMQIDPTDDCTFWYTNEYIATTGDRTWRTRIGSLRFPSCTSAPNAPTGVMASAGPGSAAVSWSAAVQIGTSPITGYTVTANPSAGSPASCTTIPTTVCVFPGLTNGTPYTFTVTATTAVGTSVASSSSAPVTPGLQFTPLVSARLMDTRPDGVTIDHQFESGGPIGQGQTIDLTVINRGGVPGSGVGAVALNVTATGPTAAGFMTVFPTGVTRPLSSNLNFVSGETTPNMVIVPVGAGGEVSIFNNSGATQAIVDVLGWFPTGAGITPLTPARLMDTRPDGVTIDHQFEGGGPIGQGQTVDLTVAARGGVGASGVGAVVLNVTATAPTGAGFMTVFPTGVPRPLSSNLNFVPGETTPNMVIVPVGAGGQVSIYNNSGSTQVIVDVLGWFPTGQGVAPLVPARLMDTRPGGSTVDGQFAGLGPIGSGQTVNLTVIGRGGLAPSSVNAVVLNVTATASTGAGFMTVFPTGVPRPLSSNLNVVPGGTTPNMVIARVGAGGQVSIFNNTGSTQVIVDVLGWFPS
jgi:hypothetical protein